MHDISERERDSTMASPNNVHEPIVVSRNEPIEPSSQEHMGTQQLPLVPPQFDQHEASSTELSPSIAISIPSTTADYPRPYDLLSPAGQSLSGIPTAYLEEDASRNFKSRDIWEESMEGVGSAGAPHKKTAVLMISWAEELDELGTGPEVRELSEVFRKQFNYDVVEVELTVGVLPQKQLWAHLATFIRDFDTESTLLIIYYAGHGVPGQPGELYFASKKTDKARSDQKNSIPWHKVEAGLQIAAQGDILLIFDCCYAGNLDTHFDGRGHWASRSFELLAACRHDEKTHPPGPKSFTKALIWALKSLLEKRQSFSTHELQMKISHAKGFPSKQGVRIIDRGEPSDHRLILAAVSPLSDSASLESETAKPSISRPKKFIDLRFWYDEYPDEDEVKELANRLKQLILREHIKTARIGWTRLGNVDQTKTVRAVLETWKGLRHRRSMTTLPRIVIPQSSSQTHLQPSYTPPISHSGNSSISDAHTEPGNVFSTPLNVPEFVGADGAANNKRILDVNDAEKEDPAEHKNRGLALSRNLTQSLKDVPHVVSFNIHLSGTATLLSVALLSSLISFGLFKYVFNKK